MNKIQILLFMLLCISTVACVKEKRETTYNNQEDKIDQYIKNNMYVNHTVDGVQTKDTLGVVFRGGSSRLILQEGIGEELKPDGTVSIYYAGYTFSGSKSYSNMFATNREATASEAKWTLTDQQYSLYTIDMSSTEIMEGLRDGLIGVKSGEICQILFSGKYAFGKKPVGIIPANSAILFEIWVEAVSNE